MTKQYLLGIDIGTSACKVALFGKDGKVEAAVSEGYPVYYPHPGWAEQNPDEWWEAVCKAIWTVISSSGVSPDDIAGIGIDGQSWSAIAIDEEVKKYVMQKIMVAGYTGQNAITEGDLECILTRNCEGTEQLRINYEISFLSSS